MAKTFTLADESLNSYGFWLVMDGCDLKQFKKNPVMLWMHMRAWRGSKDEVLPIGRWENIRIEDGKLLADAVFDENDEFALAIADKVENDFLKMASVGITVINTSNDPKSLKPGQYRETVTKWKPREASIVDIGANDNALSMAFYDEGGNPLELKEGDVELPVRLLQQNNNTNQNETQMKKTLMLVSLPENATDEQLAEKVQELMSQKTKAEADKAEAERKYKELSDKLASEKKAEATSLIDAAIKDGRLSADVKPQWEKFFDTDHEAAKVTLSSIQKRQKVSEELSDAEKSEYSKLEKMSWDELDKSQKLSLVKEKYWDLYEEKFEAKYGKKPVKK
jgi:hypothetical protein